VVIQLGWLWGAFVFALTAATPGELFMGLTCAALIIGLYFRWRAAFWISALIMAASVGGVLARIIVNDQGEMGTAPPLSLALGITLLMLHQISKSLAWFRFQRPRPLRLGFWLLAAWACAGSEFLMTRLINSAR